MPDSVPSRNADVIVIGGGIIGSSIALRLAQARLRVTVFDRGEPGGEASTAAAGMIAPQSERLTPKPFFELCAASHGLYPEFVTEIEGQTGASVGYRRDGTVLVATDDSEERELEEIYGSHKQLGLPVERLTAAALGKQMPGLSPRIRTQLFLPSDQWVDNERLTRAVVRAAELAGVGFFAGCAARKLGIANGRVEHVEVAEDPGRPSGKFSAGHIILAAGCWSGELAESAGLDLRMKPCRGQLLELEPSVELPHVIRAGHHYLVPRSSHRVLAGTTAEYVGYEKAVTAAGIRSILDGVSRIAPVVDDFRFRRCWAGLRPDTADHLPILGYGEQRNLIFATGHFRNGILLAPVTAQLISELVLTGSTSRSLELYRPTRFASAPRADVKATGT